MPHGTAPRRNVTQCVRCEGTFSLTLHPCHPDPRKSTGLTPLVGCVDSRLAVCQMVVTCFLVGNHRWGDSGNIQVRQIDWLSVFIRLRKRHTQCDASIQILQRHAARATKTYRCWLPLQLKWYNTVTQLHIKQNRKTNKKQLVYKTNKSACADKISY